MRYIAEYSPWFREHGFRMTSQRLAILRVLRSAGGHLSPGQIYEQSRDELPGLTEPTVYRTLEFLTRNGLARSSHLANGKTVYELAGREHHHLVCRRCGRTVEVEHASLGPLYLELESASGYKLDPGHVSFFGLCPQCQGITRS